MNKSFWLVFMLPLLLLVAGCSKDRDTFSPRTDTFYEIDINGLVTDENGSPVEGATVTYMGQVQKTDKSGIYLFKKVEANATHNTLSINQPGFFDANRVFIAVGSSEIKLKSILLKKEFNYSFSSVSGGSIYTPDKIGLNFPAGSIVYESGGGDYTGVVQVAVKYIEPTGNDLLFKMPGNLTAINANKENQVLATFGMMAVELRSDKGDKLNIKPGQQVKASIEVPYMLLANAPGTLPIWYFDENTGYWMEGGSATLTNRRYTGFVSHFSYWNYDSPRPCVKISGKVKDQAGNPVPDVCVWFKAEGEWSGGYGMTNAAGEFGGMAAKDATLNIGINAYNDCSQSTIPAGQTGPFAGDAVIPDIIIPTNPSQIVSVSGSFRDCQGNSVREGYLKVYNDNHLLYKFPISNGWFGVTFATCSATGTYKVVAVDRIGLQESAPISIPVTGNVDLGIVNVCGSQADYINIKCGALGLDMTFTDSIIAYDIDGIKNLYGYYTPDGKNAKVLLSYYGLADNLYSTGWFTAIGDKIVFEDASKVSQTYTIEWGAYSDNIHITEVGNSVRGKIKGTFALFASKPGKGTTEIFTGSFQFTKEE